MNQWSRKPVRPRYVVGLMSGTSADGIDAVVAEIAGTGRGLSVHILSHVQQAFTKDFRRRVLHACLHGSVADVCELNFVLGEMFAKATLAAIRKARLKPKDIYAIGSHGQTVHHLPNAQKLSTLQIGEPAVIAERTGITTVADFRVRDVAAGGQGAPLVPYVDWALITSPSHPRIVQNIGGIGNLTWLPSNASLADVRAFDTGPGNMVIDAVVHALSGGRLTYDRKGSWAARGRVSEKLVKQWLKHPFFKRQPPKSTGREEFGEVFFRRVVADARKEKLAQSDIVATVTALTAASIAEAYRRFVYPNLSRRLQELTQVVLVGGGALNPVLRGMIAERVRPAQLCPIEEFGMCAESKEALSFAVLAHETLQDVPGNVPSVTGARRAVVLGSIVPGNHVNLTP
ncbi:MAG: anhydro-N-acetylmuramic acid kinase [Verrucomicrobia bacterium]|nr:MAG: anhydro-N-acetylmuramic acid kinase [Verrucomicrobiota bacterium]